MTAETHAADLLERGYEEVQEWGDLHVGDPVHHIGQVFARGRAGGTAAIERIFHHPTSAWAQKYGRADVEIIVRHNEPQDWGEIIIEHGYWADYHTVKADQ